MNLCQQYFKTFSIFLLWSETIWAILVQGEDGVLKSLLSWEILYMSRNVCENNILNLGQWPIVEEEIAFEEKVNALHTTDKNWS